MFSLQNTVERWKNYKTTDQEEKKMAKDVKNIFTEDIQMTNKQMKRYSISSDIQFSSAQFSRSVVSNSLQPHGLQHASPPCPSPTPGVYPNSCPLSWWCHPAISSSVIPFSSYPQSFPASGAFPVIQFFASGSQSIGASVSTSVLPVNTQDWSSLGWTGGISLQSKGLSRVFSQYHNDLYKTSFSRMMGEKPDWSGLKSEWEVKKWR